MSSRARRYDARRRSWENRALLIGSALTLAGAAGSFWSGVAAKDALPPLIAVTGLAMLTSLVALVLKLRDTNQGDTWLKATTIQLDLRNRPPSVRDADLILAFHVHRSVATIPYLERAGQGAEEAVRRAIRERTPVLVKGSSLAGKSRLLAHVLKQELPDWPLLAFEEGGNVEQFVKTLKHKNAVFLFDRLERFLTSGGLTPGLIDILQRDGNVIAATVEDVFFNDSALPGVASDSNGAPQRDAFAAWQLLQRFTTVRLNLEGRRALEELAGKIPNETVRDGIVRAGGIGVYLGGGDLARELLDAYQGSEPCAYALVRAAVDWRLTQIGDAIPKSIARSLVPAYVSTLDLHLSGRHLPHPNDEEGWRLLEEPAERWLGNDKVAQLLAPVDGGAAWRAFDYLTSLFTVADIPPETWDAVSTTDADPIHAVQAGVAALQAGRRDVAMKAWESAANRGDSAAMNHLAMLLAIDSPVTARRWLERAAAARHPEAIRTLGLLTEAADPEEAKRLYTEAADAGDPEAMNSLGVILLRTDRATAVSLFERAARAGNPRAMHNLGIQLELLQPADAERWYERAGEAGLASAFTSLGMLVEKRADSPTQAIPWYQRAADGGDAEGMNNLGVLMRDYGFDAYRYRSPTAKVVETRKVGRRSQRSTRTIVPSARASEGDVRSSLRYWFQRGAEAGSDRAMVNLADELRGSDLKMAIRWLERAARIGNVGAMLRLGDIYSRLDPLVAADWYQRAAESGNVFAAESRDRVLWRADRASALNWYAKLAETGNTDGTKGLAHLLEARDLAAAERYYRAAFGDGDIDAAYWLGRLLEKVNHQAAIDWYHLAAKAGDTGAMLGLSRVLRVASPESSEAWSERSVEVGSAIYTRTIGRQREQRSAEDAAKWYKVAALYGDVGAMYDLARVLEQSASREALEWYEKAAGAGHADAGARAARLAAVHSRSANRPRETA